eukprot:6203597-Pleurochrysis_carterae.AAC.4
MKLRKCTVIRPSACLPDLLEAGRTGRLLLEPCLGVRPACFCPARKSSLMYPSPQHPCLPRRAFLCRVIRMRISSHVGVPLSVLACMPVACKLVKYRASTQKKGPAKHHCKAGASPTRTVRAAERLHGG